MKRFKLIAILIMFIGVVFAGFGPRSSAQSKLFPAQNSPVKRTKLALVRPEPSPLFPTELGDPIPGLDFEELGRFQSGKFEFERDHSVDEGLGPTFNDVRCSTCHGFPVTGGSLVDLKDLTLRIGRLKKDGTYDPLERQGGEPVSSKSVSSIMAGCDQPAIKIPAKAQFVSPRAGQQLFGLGLIDTIPEALILANADPDDRDRDGISGRPNLVFSAHFKDTRVGRFGWKAHLPTLFDFSGDAYQVEIGITSPDFPNEKLVNGQVARCDLVADPEDFDGRVIQTFVDYMSFLAPPPTKPLSDSALRGRQLFSDIGCAKCHIPTMRSATLSENPDIISPVLAAQDFNLYSDLLLHDLGSELEDGIMTGTAQGNEWRTQPLWGLSSKRFFLHDGRTTSIDAAIRAHGGESEKIRNRYIKLKSNVRQDLLNFLGSL